MLPNYPMARTTPFAPPAEYRRSPMAVGLEVRVPFCDHRLVEYVYRTPWAMKTFDGREKSLVRAAAGDVLPRSVLERVKSQYPSTQDTQYLGALQQQGKELLADQDNPVFGLMNADWLSAAVALDPAAVQRETRRELEQVLDVAVWLDLYRLRLAL